MADKKCPKCNKQSDNLYECSACGLVFQEYESLKLEKLGEIRLLLSAGKFKEAKTLAEHLPAQFPDSRVDFTMLLSNINRDISIVEKYQQAKQCCEEGDCNQASLLLRNIKAFDHNLNEKVISLRRKAERSVLNVEKFDKAVDEFNNGNYVRAKRLFQEIDSSYRQDDVLEYLDEIDGIIRETLGDAIESINIGQYAEAEDRFTRLQEQFPDLDKEIETYLHLLGQRSAIRAQILAAAQKARQEKRLLESKIMYAYLGHQYPEFRTQAQRHAQEIGPDVLISLADVQESGMFDLSALGVDLKSVDQGQATATDYNADIPSDTASADSYTVATVEGNQAGIPSVLVEPVNIDVEVIADFIF